MSARNQSVNLESLHAIATMVAQQRSVNAVLETVVKALVDSFDLALARIWLTRAGDICDTCPMRDACPDRTRCLHLVASAARPTDAHSPGEWHRVRRTPGRTG